MNDNTEVRRQIHPTFVQQERVQSRAFAPTPKDKGLLSVYDGDQKTSEEAFLHYTQELKLNSCGVASFTVAEVKQNGSLDVRPDPEPFPAHAVVDFTQLSEKERKNVAKKLRDFAVKRIWRPS